MITRYNAASDILYRWACELITTSDAKKLCKELAGFEIDFRQPDIGAYVQAFDVKNNTFTDIHF